MEIGSIFEIAPGAVCAAEEAAAKRIPSEETEKYGKKNICLTASGREAIALALKSLENNRPQLPKRCLLPAYMCDTVFFPFERAGWDIHFYHLNRELAADAQQLSAQIDHIRPGLLFIHPYYGVDTWKPMRSLLHTWKEQDICIMEDVTQSYYLEGAGAEADYVVGSLRKWYAIPDGGFAASNEKLKTEGIVQNREFTEKRMELLTQKWEYLQGTGSMEDKQALKAEYLGKNRAMEEWLDAYDGISALSVESAAILRGADESQAKMKRNENYRYLYERLSGKTQFVPILKEEPAAAPLYFAVYAKDRDELQSYLRERKVYAPVLWPIGEANRESLTKEEQYIYEHMLALPMDQRYGEAEMQYMAEVLEEYEREKVSELVGIRVDANDTVATGHVMRCITIAKQLRKKGCRILFFIADEYPIEWLRQAEMDYVCLHSDWQRMEEELPALREALIKTGCKKLFVDSYQATEAYFEGLGDICKLIYIDDCFEGVYPVDMLINYNAYYVRFPYKETYEREADVQNGRKTRLLLGTSYVPLREEFWKDVQESGQKCIPENETCPHVLLSSGGGDSCNALTGILEKSVTDEQLQQVIFHVIVGRFHQNVKELEQLALRYPNIRLHYNVNHMARLMAQCTAAVSAAGTVLFELSAMQLPAVFFVSADNQQYDSEFFAKEERMLFAGDIRENREGCLEEISSCLKQLLKDTALRQRMKAALHQVTDGNGAARIADEIFGL